MKKFLVFLVSFLVITTSLFSTALADDTIHQEKAERSFPESGYMCLTFDDGTTSRTNIKKILNCLRKNGIQCTFFLKGSILKTNSDLWRQAITDGHEICYHTTNHNSVANKTKAQIVKDINDWNTIAHKTLGADYQIPKLARLPGGGGHKDPRILKIFNDLGYYVIGWNMDTYTGVIKKKPPKVSQKIAKYIKDNSKVGNISLQHFGGDDICSVPLYINYLKKHFKLTKVSIALAAKIENTK